MNKPASNKGAMARAFSLVEVVIATAIFATSIVAIIGLMSPLTKRVEDIIDSETAGRLAESIQVELARIGFTDAVTLTDSGADMILVANSRGDRVRLAVASGTPPADNALDHATLPGIANRDRYFLITLGQQVTYSSFNSGSVALRATVVWPFQLPSGPASTTTAFDGDEFSPTDAAVRQTLSYFFALTP